MLYVYDYSLFSDLRTNFPEKEMVTLTELYLKCSNLMDLEDTLDDSYYEEIQIVEITNQIRFSANDLFLETYIITLKEKLPNVNFAIQSLYVEELKVKFPLLFDEEDYLYEYVQEKNENSQLESSVFPIVVLLNYYSSTQNIGELSLEKQVISLAILMESANAYNISNILEQLEVSEVRYIDISTLVDKLKDQSNLVFDFQILLYSLIKSLSPKNNIKFVVSENLLSDAINMFPNLFQKGECIETVSKVEEITLMGKHETEALSRDLNALIDIITDKLIGHTDFKEKFKRNFINFQLLNKISERKILSILITGESGIGKTEFAKIVSKTLYPEEKLIKINFGNYSTEGALNSLIGSPLGYVGSEKGGELIEKIANSKSKVILIDEFEKATIGIFNFFYELLEDGKFTDRKGIEHNLDEYIIIFTSNMTEKLYLEIIPAALRSRFDIISQFVGLKKSQKTSYIDQISKDLSHKLLQEFSINIDLEIPEIKSKLYLLADLNNLREIKRGVQSIVTEEFQRISKKRISE